MSSRGGVKAALRGVFDRKQQGIGSTGMVSSRSAVTAALQSQPRKDEKQQPRRRAGDSEDSDILTRDLAASVRKHFPALAQNNKVKTNNATTVHTQNDNRKPERKNQEIEMWVERFRPVSISDLIATLSKAKIQTVCEWFERALDITMGHDWTPASAAARKKAQTAKANETALQQYRQTTVSRPRILLLHGSSGVGKTSALEVIAREAQVGIREWQADILPPNTNAGGHWNDNDTDSDPGGGRQFQMRGMSEVHVRYISQLADFEKFVRQGRYASVLQTTTKAKNANSSHKDSKNNKQLLLVDSLPHLHAPDAVKRFQQALLDAADDFGRAGSNGRNDTALAITFTCETETSNPTELREAFSDEFLNHPMVHVVDMKVVSVFVR
jgi:predicted ATPase